MKRDLLVGIVLSLVGVVTGAAGTRSLTAQRPPVSYVIGEVLDVSNQEDYNAYAAGVPATVAKYGGRYLVRGGKTESLEGEPPKRIVVLAFDAPDGAARWYASPEYSAIRPTRQRASKARLFLVEGVAP